MKQTKGIAAVLLALIMAVSSCYVPANAAAINTSKMKISSSKLTLEKGKKKTLSVSGLPAKKKITLKWSSNNKAVATVSSKGKVAAVKKGKATITCKVVYKKKTLKKLTCKVTVKDKTVTADVGLDPKEPSDKKARTIMMFTSGTMLERDDACLTKNLTNAMSADISDDINFLVMTGGTELYHMEKTRTFDANGKNISISTTNIQIWKLEKGRMTLVKTLGDYTRNEYFTKEIVRDYIDYCAKYFPADKYDMILWSHGFGIYGFGESELPEDELTITELANAIKESTVDRLELLDFDCCLMGGTEVLMGLSDYAKNFVFAADSEPGSGQVYSGWLGKLSKAPDTDGYTVGRWIVDDYAEYYMNDTDYCTTLTALKADDFLKKYMAPVRELSDILLDEASKKGANGSYNFYDELLSSRISVQYNTDAVGAVDVGNFADALGVCVTESDNMSSSDAAKLNNRYTSAAKQIKDVLSDQSVIYVRNNKIYTNKSCDLHIGRDSSQSPISDKKITPAGLGISFPYYKGAKIGEYISASEDIQVQLKAAGSEQDKEKILLLSALKDVQKKYFIISRMGEIISSMSEEGQKDITLKKVISQIKEDITNQMNSAAWIDEFEKTDAAWLSEIFEQQKKEVLTKDKISVTSDGSYDVSVKDVPVKVLDYITPYRYDVITGSNKGDEIVLTNFWGDIDKSLLSTNASNILYGRSDLYKKNEVKLTAQAFDNKWYRLKDDKGNTHLVSVIWDDDSYTTGSILMSVNVRYKTDDGYDIKEEVTILLTVEKKSDKNLNITGVYRVTFFGPVPLDSDDIFSNKYKDMYAAYGPNMYFTVYRIDDTDPVSYDMTKKDLGFSIDPKSDLAESVSSSLFKKLYIKDIYGVEHMIEM